MPERHNEPSHLNEPGAKKPKVRLQPFLNTSEKTFGDYSELRSLQLGGKLRSGDNNNCDSIGIEFYTRQRTSLCTAMYGNVRRRIWAAFGDY
jgi:hypothetical protein